MKKILLNFLLIFSILSTGFAQGTSKEKKKDTPVNFPWDSELLIDNQTTLSPPAKTLECIIQHRFGLINQKGISDLFGIYAPGANIRLGLNYTPVKNLTIGYGLTKGNMYSDFQAKWVILEQTRSNRIPVAVAVFGDFAIDGRSNSVFGTTYKFIDRFSYFSQLIVSRKFADWLSLEVTGSFTHYNMVASTGNHDNIGVGINGQIKFSPQSSIIFQYDIPLKIQGISEQRSFTETNSAKANFGFGYQVETAGHSFQIYFTTADGILPQDIYMHNHNDWKKGDFMLGFTITRLWNF
jgi:hypothetical protein